jgi:hypothetical protein
MRESEPACSGDGAHGTLAAAGPARQATEGRPPLPSIGCSWASR